MTRKSRAVLTIAVGKPIYHEMATALARSFLLWNEGNGIGFILVTDDAERIANDVRRRVDVRTPAGIGPGFTAKLSIDRLSDADASLFIDADCLCFRSLAPVFDFFEGHPVATVGSTIVTGECWGDVETILDRAGLTALPRFVGAIYYFERGEQARAVFDKARQLEPRYEEIGLRHLRNRRNEEPLIAIAMAKAGLFPLDDDGTIKADLMFARRVDLDVTGGKAEMAIDLPWRTIDHATPAIVHFNCTFADMAVYKHQVLVLQAASHGKWAVAAAHATGRLAFEYPERMWRQLKDTLRPVYRRLFGTRRIRAGKRV